MKHWKGDIINMWAGGFSENVSASISGGVGVFVYACVHLCVCVFERETDDVTGCKCERQKVPE